MEVMDTSSEMSIGKILVGENNSIINQTNEEDDLLNNSRVTCVTPKIPIEANDILNISNLNNIVPEIAKDPDDILSASKSSSIVPEDVGTRTRPQRGRPKGSYRPASANREVKGRENRTKSLAPFEKEGPLSREDVRCVICVSIFIEPVVLPCKHCLCLECYQTSMSQATLCCPICRFRLSNWGRKNTGNLIHKDFWKRIQAQFPEAVEARLMGQDSQSIPIYDSPTKLSVMRDGCAAQEGEILQELEVIQKQHEADLEIQKRKEAEASSEYIRQLQQLEGPPPPSQSPTQVLRDYELAKKLQEEEELARQAERARAASNAVRQSITGSSKSNKKTSSSSRSRSSSKKRGKDSLSSITPTSSGFKRLCTTDVQAKQNKITNFFEPTPTPAPKSRSGTPDSINFEFSQHFQPIAPAPKTPPKRNSDGSVEESVFVNSRPVRRDLSIDFGFVETNQTRSPMELTGRHVEVDRGFENCVPIENLQEPGLLLSGNTRGSETRPEEQDKPINTSNAEFKLDSTNESGASSSFAKSPVVEPVPVTIPEKELDRQNELEILMRNEDPRNPAVLRTVEYYLNHSGSADSVVMGSDESDGAEQRREAKGTVNNQEILTPRPKSPFPSDPGEDSANSSEYEFNLSLADRLEQERVLAQLKQEEEDRKFALKLQKELNKPVLIREKYELRKSDDRSKVKYNEENKTSTTDGDIIYNNQPSSSSGNRRSTRSSTTRAQAPNQKRTTSNGKTTITNTATKLSTPASTATSDFQCNDSSGRRYPPRRRNIPAKLKSPTPSTSSSSSLSSYSMPMQMRRQNIAKRLPSSSSSSSSDGPPCLTPQKPQPLQPVSIPVDNGPIHLTRAKTNSIKSPEKAVGNSAELETQSKKPTRKRRKRFPSTSSSGSSTGVAVGSPTKEF